MIDMTSHMMNRVTNLNNESERISYQLSTGKVIQNGSDDSVLYAKVLNIEDKIRTYNGLEKQIDNTVSQNNVSDTALGEVKNVIDTLKLDLLKSLNEGMDLSARSAIAVNISGIRENLMNISNTKVDGEYLFSGSDTTKTTYEKDDNFAANGRVEFGGDALLRNIAVEPNIYRQRGVTGLDVLMYNTDTADASGTLDFTQRERIIDENNLEWTLNKATTSNKLTFNKSDVIRDDDNVLWTLNPTTLKLVNDTDNNITLDVVLVEGNKYQTAPVSGLQADGGTLGYLAVDDNTDGSINATDLKMRSFTSTGLLTGTSGEVAVTETAGTPNTYSATTVGTNTDGTTNSTRFLEAKHNYFDDLNVIINALKSYDTNPDGTKGAVITEAQMDVILRNAVEQTSNQYSATNIGHAELGGRNKIFEIAHDSISAKQVHYNILLQKTNGADISKLAMESKSLEMTYQALYSTVAKMHSLSLLNYIK